MSQIVLINDADCWLCRRFSTYIALRKHHDVTLYEAQEVPELLSQLYAQGYDINQGMILQIDSEVYVGPAAASKISLLIGQKSLLDKLIVSISRSKLLMRVCYPLFSGLRTCIYRVEGRSSRIDVE